MENEIKDNIKLPENAFTELKEGEEYQPVMSPDKAYPEVNGWSVTWGVLMAILFSAAAAYLGLRVGQVFEAAIPRGRVYGSQAPQPPGRERHHTEHRSMLRSRGGRCHIHPARPLHPQGQVS